ncbi:hypothetical protein [Nitrosomonas sp.]|uniref:hypothetical protein n=1 Tax=Nitrosomonas sp. TaxID=42353 RepID=UPI0025D88B12|nr:hypothetical protein [Nitrosomonas sp.]
MLRRSSTIHRPNLFETELLVQLDPNDPLLKLASAIPWQDLRNHFPSITPQRQVRRVSRSD